MLRIEDAEGNRLLDPKNPDNVRDNNFYIEYNDSIISMENPGQREYTKIADDGKGWYNFYMSLDPYSTEVNYGYTDIITIGEGGARYGRLDRTFTFVWPERNIRTACLF